VYAAVEKGVETPRAIIQLHKQMSRAQSYTEPDGVTEALVALDHAHAMAKVLFAEPVAGYVSKVQDALREARRLDTNSRWSGPIPREARSALDDRLREVEKARDQTFSSYFSRDRSVGLPMLDRFELWFSKAERSNNERMGRS
jgi:hypothetical protein